MPDPSGTTEDIAERLAVLLGTFGMQRMHARVFCALLFTDAETMTAADLSDRLTASAGSISGALKMLSTIGLVERVHRSSDRRDHWRFRDDAWPTMYSRENILVTTMIDSAEQGAALAGPGSPAYDRLIGMRDFFSLVLTEMGDLVATWRDTRPLR